VVLLGIPHAARSAPPSGRREGVRALMPCVLNPHLCPPPPHHQVMQESKEISAQHDDAADAPPLTLSAVAGQDIQLTSEQLKALSPEQIYKLYQVGGGLRRDSLHRAVLAAVTGPAWPAVHGLGHARRVGSARIAAFPKRAPSAAGRPAEGLLAGRTPRPRARAWAAHALWNGKRH
jgi:hypothetical protein